MNCTQMTSNVMSFPRSRWIITDLDKESRYDLLVFAVVPGNSVHCFRNVLQNKVQIDLVLLNQRKSQI